MPKTKELLKITKAHAGPRGISPVGTIGVGCEYEGARYHIWLDPVTMTAVDGIVYKNAVVERDHPDHFNTRRMKVGTEFTDGLVEAMLHAYTTKGLLAKFEAQEAKDRARDHARAEKILREKKVTEAAPKLLEHTKRLAALLPNIPMSILGTAKTDQWIKEVWDLLRKIDHDDAAEVHSRVPRQSVTL